MATLFAIDQDLTAPEVLPVSTLFAIDQDQTAPEGAILSVATLFAIDQEVQSYQCQHCLPFPSASLDAYLPEKS